jgi:hypothetical protein
MLQTGTASALRDDNGQDYSRSRNTNSRRKKFFSGNLMIVEYFNRLKNGTEGGTDMRATEIETAKPSYWQLIFLQSKVNGAAYSGEELPGRNWDWPKDTYLQRRLQRSRYFRLAEGSKLN